jgi:hypothetical protein
MEAVAANSFVPDEIRTDPADDSCGYEKKTLLPASTFDFYSTPRALTMTIPQTNGKAHHVAPLDVCLLTLGLAPLFKSRSIGVATQNSTCRYSQAYTSAGILHIRRCKSSLFTSGAMS